MLPNYTRVSVRTDKYANVGVPRGTFGYVIEVYRDGHYEVEFSDPATGISFAQLVVAEEDVSESPEAGPRR